MFPQLASIAGAVVLGLGLLAGTFFLGMRSKNPIVLGAVIWVSKTWLNKSQMRTAGTPGAYAGSSATSAGSPAGRTRPR